MIPPDVAVGTLAVVRRAEEALGLEASPTRFELLHRALRSDEGVPGLDPHRVPDPHLRWRGSDELVSVEAEVASRYVVIGKYNRSTQVKARAYVAADEGPATLKVWRMGEGESPLGARERDVRAQVAPHAHYRAPEVLAHGRTGDVDYLLERVVHGRHPRTPEEVRAAAEDLLPALARAYRASGRLVHTVSAMLPRDLPERLASAVSDDSTPWPCADDERAETGRFLVDLVAANRRLVCALGHGDLVATNIVRADDGGHVLIDWEHGRVLPVAFDVGKLLRTAGADHGLRRRAAAVTGWRRHLGRGMYTWSEQLVLGLCLRLAYAPERHRRAVAAGREDRFVREHEAEVRHLLELVADCRR